MTTIVLAKKRTNKFVYNSQFADPVFQLLHNHAHNIHAAIIVITVTKPPKPGNGSALLDTYIAFRIWNCRSHLTLICMHIKIGRVGLKTCVGNVTVQYAF